MLTNDTKLLPNVANSFFLPKRKKPYSLKYDFSPFSNSF